MNNIMLALYCRTKAIMSTRRSGMELVQVAIIICLAIGLGIIFKDKIQEFMGNVFEGFSRDSFTVR